MVIKNFLLTKKTANKLTVFNRMGKIIVLDGSVALLPEQQPLLFPFAWQLPSRCLLHPNSIAHTVYSHFAPQKSLMTENDRDLNDRI